MYIVHSQREGIIYKGHKMTAYIIALINKTFFGKYNYNTVWQK